MARAVRYLGALGFFRRSAPQVHRASSGGAPDPLAPTEAEAQRLWSTGADPLVVRLAFHADIPIDYIQANRARISELLQLEVIADIRDRINVRRALLDDHKQRTQKYMRNRGK